MYDYVYYLYIMYKYSEQLAEQRFLFLFLILINSLIHTHMYLRPKYNTLIGTMGCLQCVHQQGVRTSQAEL